MDATELSPSGSPEVRIRKEAARAFSIVGVVSIGLGLVVLVFASLPVRLMDPVWQLQLSGAMTAAGFSLLIGVLLVCTAGALPVSAQPVHDNVKLLRNICTWVAVAYLVLIPVQLYAGVRVLQKQSRDDAKPQAGWRRFKKQLEAVSNEQELRTLLGQLPQPINLPPKLDQPFPALKESIIAQADSRFNALKYQTDQASSQRLQGFISEGANNTLKSLLLATGFAAMAQGKPGGPTLLDRALGLFGNKPRRRGRLP
jgi:hypothetical protein